MTIPTPTTQDLLRHLDPQAVGDLLEAGARISCELTDELDALMGQLRQITRGRLEEAGQLQLDLSVVEPGIITPCMSPPRDAFAGYAQWLRAGGGRGVNAPCGAQCPCGGSSPWARDTYPHRLGR